MSNAIEIYRATGTSVEKFAAMRADGQWFARYRERGPYGRRWTAWREISAPDLTPPSYDPDYGQVGAGWQRTHSRAVRLPSRV